MWKLTVMSLLFGAATAAGSACAAQNSPIGVWLDHTGRAAIEITDCNGSLCGRLVWFKDPLHNSACHLQVIGEVRPVSGGKWDYGWILDPEKNAKYSVEIMPMGEKLKVVGYAGMKMLGETFTWTRAADDLISCDGRTAGRMPSRTSPGASPRSTPDPGTAAIPGTETSPSYTPPATAPQHATGPQLQRGDVATRQCKFEMAGFKLIIPCDDEDED